MTILLLLVISINTVLYYFYFGFSELRYKAEAYLELISSDKTAYKTIAVPLSQFNKNNTGEIWVQGLLYDIASYKVSGDSVYIKVRHDNKEEKLVNDNNEHFEKLAPAANTSDTRQLARKNITFKDDWKIVACPISPQNFQHHKRNFISHDHSAICLCYPQLHTPPPKSII